MKFRFRSYKNFQLFFKWLSFLITTQKNGIVDEEIRF